jgi:hypothetical protein
LIRPLGNRILVSPIVESRSDVIWTPEQLSRWGNGLLATKGTVLALGPEVDPDAIKVGEVAHFSDSCGKPCADGILIREDDVMFVCDASVKAEWVGAVEVSCDVE